MSIEGQLLQPAFPSNGQFMHAAADQLMRGCACTSGMAYDERCQRKMSMHTWMV